MITGDENIVDIDFVVFWRIADAGQYLFNLADPDQTIKVAAEAVMREIIGQTRIQTALTEGRQSIQVSVRQKLQELLDEYKAGVRVREVQLLAVDPPSDVIDAFRQGLAFKICQRQICTINRGKIKIMRRLCCRRSGKNH